MTTEARIIHEESSTGWLLNVWKQDGHFRCHVETPEGTIVFIKPVATSLEDDDGVFESVHAFFAGRGLEPIGRALIEQARAEIKFDGQP